MPKITLGKPPKTWTREVTFTQLDGTEGAIPVTFKYRTRLQYGELIDKMAQAAGDAARKAADARRAAAAAKAADKAGNADEVADAVGEADTSMEAFYSRTVDQNVEFLLAVLDGWGLDVDMTRDTLHQLCNELPGGAVAIMTAYRIGTVEGRLGN